MTLEEVKKIEDDQEMAIQAALCPDIPEHVRSWFALLACAIGLQRLDKP